MACSSCGQRRATITEAQAQAVIAAGRTVPVYVVTTPAGEVREFLEYIEAATFRVQTDGVMTTTNAQV